MAIKYELWPFQKQIVEDNLRMVREYEEHNASVKEGKRKQLSVYSVAPTGTGKSVIIADLVYRIGRPTIILQPSKELLFQNYEKFINNGGNATIFSASAGSKMASDCMFATPGSVVKYGSHFKNLLGIDTVLIDECHFKVKGGSADEDLGQVRSFLHELRPKNILGFTATPVRLTSSNIGPTLVMLHRSRNPLFNDVCSVVQIKDIYNQYWKQLEYKQYNFDESKLVTTSGGLDYTEESVEISVKENGVNNNILIETMRQVNQEGRRAILIFCDSVSNGETMANYLNSKGIPSCALSGKTPKAEREENVAKFKNQEYYVMINHSLFTTGFDYPALDCVMLGRPTKSFSLLYQMIGRLVRLYPGLVGLCIDFCKNIHRIGYVNDITFENIHGYGWGMFSGDYLMSGRPLEWEKKTKQDLIFAAQRERVKTPYLYFDFGKYKGHKIEDVYKKDPGYIQYMMGQMDDRDERDFKIIKTLETFIN